MRQNHRIVTAVLLLAGLLICCSSASAQSVWNYGAAGCYGGNYGYYGYVIPYFSMHPPVYYSQPVPRTYGYSPYAYPPGTPTPEVEIEELDPHVMINPFVPGDAQPVTEQTASAPLVIRNPFVESPEQAASVEVAARP